MPKLTLLKVTAELDPFMSRTLCVAEDPKLVSGKDRLVGDTVTLPVDTLPSKGTFWVVLGNALSVIVSVAFRVGLL